MMCAVGAHRLGYHSISLKSINKGTEDGVILLCWRDVCRGVSTEPINKFEGIEGCGNITVVSKSVS